MFGLGPLISLAIYAGIAAVALGAIYGFDKSRQNVGRDKQIAADAPVMELCSMFPSKGLFGGTKASDPAECAKHLRDSIAKGVEAEAANVSLAKDVEAWKGQHAECSAAVKRIERQVDVAKAAIAARKPTDDKAIAGINAGKDSMVAELATVGTRARTCEQQLAERNAAWTAEAVRRQRDFPPTGAAPSSGDVNIRPPAVNPLRPGPAK
jgi:hypothetical protein